MKRLLLALTVAVACKSSARPPSLDEAISVEQAGGSAAQLFSQGSEIPTSATEMFTTAKDDEPRIYVHVLRGAGRTADRLRSDAWWAIDGVPSGKAGEQRILVTFEVSDKGELSLAARAEQKRLTVRKLDKPPERATPSPLSEPDDEDDAEEETK